MAEDEEAVLAATRRFYDALEHMMTGNGLGPMKEIWHHAPTVTAGHPLGEWAYGWDEVLATWEVFEKLGRADMSGSKVLDLRASVFGDVAYTTCVFVTAPFAGATKLNCTNVLRRIDGAWKIVHHHPDKAPGLEAAFESVMGAD